MKCLRKEGVGHARMGSGEETVNATVITRCELLQHYHNEQHKNAEKQTRARVSELHNEPLCQIYNAAW